MKWYVSIIFDDYSETWWPEPLHFDEIKERIEEVLNKPIEKITLVPIEEV